MRAAEDSVRLTSEEKKTEEGAFKGKSHGMYLKRKKNNMSRKKGLSEKNGRRVDKELRKGGVQSGDVW